MKAIKLNKEVIVLENLIRASEVETGTGAKSNPYKYYISLNYYDGNHMNISCSSKVEMQNTLNKIFEIITE